MRSMIALFALLSACLAHNPPVQAPDQSVALMAAVVSIESTREVAMAPGALNTRLSASVAGRGFEVKHLDDALASERFSALRTPALRREFLRSHAAPAVWVVLTEAHVRRFGEMGGRYRWTVDVRLWLAPTDQPKAGVESSFTVPVFLDRYHEREAAALEAAGPAIERRLNVLLDESLASF